MSRFSPSAAIATIGIDLSKYSFHLVGQDERGAIVPRIKLSRTHLAPAGQPWPDISGDPLLGSMIT
jgi:hypothetical protein